MLLLRRDFVSVPGEGSSIARGGWARGVKEKAEKQKERRFHEKFVSSSAQKARKEKRK
jgi:hypothetical protein